MALGEYRGPLSCKAFVRYVTCKYATRQIDMLCVSYIAESARGVAKGYYLTESLMEKVDRAYHPRPERSAQEIIDDVAARLEAS